jgi:hypothetical protein
MKRNSDSSAKATFLNNTFFFIISLILKAFFLSSNLLINYLYNIFLFNKKLDLKTIIKLFYSLFEHSVLLLKIYSLLKTTINRITKVIIKFGV